MAVEPNPSKSNGRVFCLYDPKMHADIVERLKAGPSGPAPVMTFEQFAPKFNATQTRDNDDATRRSMVLRPLHTHVSHDKRVRYAYNAYLEFCYPMELSARRVKIDPKRRLTGDKKRSRVEEAFEHEVAAAPSVPTVSERRPQEAKMACLVTALGIFAPPPPPPPPRARALALHGDNESIVSIDATDLDWDLPAPETSKTVAAGHSRGVPTWQVEQESDYDADTPLDFAKAVVVECTDGVIFATREEIASFAVLSKSSENVVAPFSMGEMEIALGRGISLDRAARAVAFLKRS